MLDDDWGHDHEQTDDDDGAFAVLYVEGCQLVQPDVKGTQAQQATYCHELGYKSFRESTGKAVKRDEDGRAVHGKAKGHPVGFSHFIRERFPGHPVGDVAPHDGGHEQDDADSNGVKR